MSYTGLNVTTDAGGTAVFDKANFTEGTYKFRVDYLNGQFWSDVASIHQDAAISVIIEEGSVDVSVRNQAEPLSGIKVYLFNSAGAYLGKNTTTDASGSVTFVLPVGMEVKFRADNLGYQFWSDPTSVIALTSVDLLIPYQSARIAVNGTYQSASDPIAGIKTYLFTAAGTYMGQTRTTDANGQVIFNLPERGYKVRADYQSKQFWSAEFTVQDASIDIPLSDARVEVTANGLPLPGVTVYVFTQSGTFLGITGVTGGDGQITFRLSAGDYKFRTDYQSSQYWRAEETLTAGQVNTVGIATGGGEFSFTVFKGVNSHLSGVNCYVFSEAGTYLGMTNMTSSEGLVTFNLSDGGYKFRVDYLGYQFWSPVYAVPATLTAALTIPHQDVTITIKGNYQAAEPIAGVPVYLFTEAGTYLYQNQSTDAAGQVVFNLPQKPYKVRADYMGQQFWSDPFTLQDAVLTINQGLAEVHVTREGNDLSGAKIYLFSETGAYLGQFQTTDVNGKVQFFLPDRVYKFRADEGGIQRWSQGIQINSTATTDVWIDLSPIYAVIN